MSGERPRLLAWLASGAVVMLCMDVWLCLPLGYTCRQAFSQSGLDSSQTWGWQLHGLAGVTGRFSSKKARTETHWARSGPTLPLEQIAVAREMEYARWLSACQLQAKGRLKFPASEVSGKRMKRGFPERKSDCWNPNRGLQHDRSKRADAHSLGFHGLWRTVKSRTLPGSAGRWGDGD